MLTLHLVTLVTLTIGISAPYLAFIVYDDMDEARKFVPFYVTFMIGMMWLFYGFAGLVRVLFGLPFIW